MIRVSLLCVVAAWAGSAPADGSQAGPATPGKMLFEDDFVRAELASKWKVGKGVFELKDGVVAALRE